MNKRKPLYTRLESQKYSYNHTGDPEAIVVLPKIASFDNIHIVRILKNCQSSLAHICHNYLNKPEYDLDNFESKTKNTFVIIIRDPNHRFMSLVNMRYRDLTSLGVDIDWQDFNLDIAYDAHLMKQIFNIPLSAYTKKQIFNTIPTSITNSITTHKNHWGDFVKVSDLITCLNDSDDDYVFFRMTGNNNPIKDICEYLQKRGLMTDEFVETKSNTRINVSGSHFKIPKQQEFRLMMQKHYEQDIEFYNKIECVND